MDILERVSRHLWTYLTTIHVDRWLMWCLCTHSMTYLTTSTNESVDVVEACQIRHTKGLGEMCTTMVGTNFAGVMFVESSKNIHHFIKKIGLP